MPSIPNLSKGDNMETAYFWVNTSFSLVQGLDVLFKYAPAFHSLRPRLNPKVSSFFMIIGIVFLCHKAFPSTLHKEKRLNRIEATTQTIKTPFPINFIGIYWPQVPNFIYHKNFYVRYSSTGKQWSSWKEVFLMTEGPDEEPKIKFDYSHLLYTKSAKFIQFKTEKIDFSKISLHEFHFVFIN